MEGEKEVRSCAIVLIDDDTVVHFIFEKLISHYCPREDFMCFSSASEALQLLKANLLSADLIVLDVNMPHMNGWAFLAELSRLHYAKPVCMLSSSDDSRDIERAKSFPMVDTYLIKPLDRENIQVIVDILARKR